MLRRAATKTLPRNKVSTPHSEAVTLAGDEAAALRAEAPGCPGAVARGLVVCSGRWPSALLRRTAVEGVAMGAAASSCRGNEACCSCCCPAARPASGTYRR